MRFTPMASSTSTRPALHAAAEATETQNWSAQYECDGASAVCPTTSRATAPLAGRASACNTKCDRQVTMQTARVLTAGLQD
jgi:hypothetical protein